MNLNKITRSLILSLVASVFPISTIHASGVEAKSANGHMNLTSLRTTIRELRYLSHILPTVPDNPTVSESVKLALRDHVIAHVRTFNPAEIAAADPECLVLEGNILLRSLGEEVTAHLDDAEISETRKATENYAKGLEAHFNQGGLFRMRDFSVALRQRMNYLINHPDLFGNAILPEDPRIRIEQAQRRVREGTHEGAFPTQSDAEHNRIAGKLRAIDVGLPPDSEHAAVEQAERELWRRSMVTKLGLSEDSGESAIYAALDAHGKLWRDPRK